MKTHHKVTVLLVLLTQLVIVFSQKSGERGWDKGNNHRHNNGNNGYQQPIYVNSFNQTFTSTIFPTITPATFTTTQSANSGAGQIDVRMQQPQG